jgi:outer membrane lipoprotein-sorting protein
MLQQKMFYTTKKSLSMSSLRMAPSLAFLLAPQVRMASSLAFVLAPQVRKAGFVLICIAFCSNLGTAQAGAKEASDPQSKIILDKLKKAYQSYTSISVDFTLSITLPERKKPEIQKGTILQQGDKYHLETTSQTIISDGKTVWFIVPNKKQVQISNADAKGNNAFISPKELLKMYERNEFVARTSGDGTEAGRAVTYIDLKPASTKKKSDFTSIRLSIDVAKNEIVSIRVSGRDQSKYNLAINKLTTKATISADKFSFDKTKYAGYKIEDLRID